MQRREFNIEISSDYGWEVDIVGFKGPYRDYQVVKDAPISIGICVKAGRKLIAMYDPFPPKDEAIIKVQTNKVFREKCIFTHLDHTFVGNFIDALKYIQEQYETNKVPTLENL